MVGGKGEAGLAVGPDTELQTPVTERLRTVASVVQHLVETTVHEGDVEPLEVVVAVEGPVGTHLVVAGCIGFGLQTLAVVTALLAIALWLVVRFIKNPSTALAKRFELMAGVWTLMMYFTLGLIPMLLS